MIRAAILPALLVLPACSLFDNSDPREGRETVEACIARITQGEGGRTMRELADARELFVPVYTYDVTKMDLDNMKGLIVEGSDETAGSRIIASTNEASTAVANFMDRNVDEKGAFFLGRDPALYRVRGKPVPLDKIIPIGCERQLPGMRLISFKAAAYSAASDTETSPDADNENAD